jgi:hypothetical protein
MQAARCAAEQPPPQQAQRSRRDALAMGAAAGILLPGMLRPGDAAAAAPYGDQPTAQPLCRASAFDACGGAAAARNPVAEVAEGGVAARTNDRIELGKSGGHRTSGTREHAEVGSRHQHATMFAV